MVNTIQLNSLISHAQSGFRVCLVTALRITPDSGIDLSVRRRSPSAGSTCLRALRPAIAHANSTMSAFAEGYKSDTWHQELHRHYWTVPPSNKFYIVTMNNTFMKQDKIYFAKEYQRPTFSHSWEVEKPWTFKLKQQTEFQSPWLYMFQHMVVAT